MALARPECAGLLSRSGYVRSGLHGWPSPRHKDPLHILLYPGHCGDPAPSRHTTPLAAPQLNASPVTGEAPVPVQLLEALRCCSRSPHLAVQRAQVTSAASLPAPGQAAGAAWLLHESM